MRKSKWNEGDLIDYLEWRYLDGIATFEEKLMYENYVWSGKLDTSNRNIVSRLIKALNTYYLS